MAFVHANTLLERGGVRTSALQAPELGATMNPT